MTESNDLSRPASYATDRDAAYGSRADIERTDDPGYETDSTVGRETSYDADRDASYGTRGDAYDQRDVEDTGDRVAEAAADPADRHGDVFPPTS